MSDTDMELLARYTRQHSSRRNLMEADAEDAFTELVRRHLGLVYSAALRQVRSPQLAEEVTQSVFIDLARSTARLKPDTILTAWLYQVTRRTAIDVVRREASRQLREQIATEMNAMNATASSRRNPMEADADWTHIEPLLDEAMHALDDTDRTAVLLRYFENKSLREVGATLGTSENAAQKRLVRAVERLREFFTKRGVTVGASGLVVVISANAVQAAPIGLTVTISTGATLAGATLTTTATVTATKAIAMTVLQKTLIAATLVAAVGTGFYEARQASIARTEVSSIRQKQEQLVTQVDQLTRERDNAASQLVALRAANSGLDRNTTELLRLRAEVTRLKTDAQAMAQLQAGITNDQTLSEAVIWRKRVDQLKQRLEQSPGARIPELQFVTEQDWLTAVKGKLDTEADYRRALSAIRDAGENKVASMLQEALAAYMKASNEQFPTDLIQLQSYFKSPLDEAVLQRWQIAPATIVQSLGLGGDKIITQKAPVDDVFDTRYGIGPHGSGSTDFFPFTETHAVISPVRDAYRAAHNGQEAESKSQLLPYATTPEQQAALQKLILRDSRSR